MRILLYRKLNLLFPDTTWGVVIGELKANPLKGDSDPHRFAPILAFVRKHGGSGGKRQRERSPFWTKIVRERKRTSILVVTGASGGHILPALSFLDRLKNRTEGFVLLLVLPRIFLESNSIMEEKLSFDYLVRYISISTIKLNFKFRDFLSIFKFLKGILESLSIILGFKPDMVVGFGTINSIPLIMFAWLFRIKTLIHEQNLLPGRANRFLSNFTDRIAISFNEARNYFKNYEAKIAFTGNPLRRELERIDKNKALDFFGLGYDKFTILAMGGSQGSHRINLSFLNALSLIRDKSKLQIIHLSGFNDYDLLKGSYKNLSLDVKLFSFLKEIQYAYSACDVIISRAGATTIAEIIFFKIPAIIIPYPFAYRHQDGNARFLEGKGCAIVIRETELDACILNQHIGQLINNPNKLAFMRSGYDSIQKTNADDLLVDEALSLIQL